MHSPVTAHRTDTGYIRLPLTPRQRKRAALASAERHAIGLARHLEEIGRPGEAAVALNIAARIGEGLK